LHGEGATDDSKRRRWGRGHRTIKGDYRFDRLLNLDPVKITV